MKCCEYAPRSLPIWRTRWTSLKNKRSSLFCPIVVDKEKSVVSLTPGQKFFCSEANVINFFCCNLHVGEIIKDALTQ